MKTLQRAQHTLLEQLITDPIGTYNQLHGRILGMPQLNESLPELFPDVQLLLDELNSARIIELASVNPAIAVLRRLTMQSLRHIAIESRANLPYQETVRALQSAIEFFDVCIRTEQSVALSQNSVVANEENPRENHLDYYHRYRYLYYWQRLLHAMPYVFPLPTSRSFTAMEMMRFRCVPIFIIGLSTEIVYVDEFEQTPAEFWFHDANHARRQYAANEAWFAAHGIATQEERVAVYQRSHAFSKRILDVLEPDSSDSEEQAALKQLMLIILFEVTHEDAEPFLPDVISTSLQRMEGFASMFEVPSVDPTTGLMNVLDTQEIGIATLSYVRAKLQGGFYDRIGEVDERIVPQQYRTVTWIARAARSLLQLIGEKALPNVPVDEDGLPTEDFLLDRVCSFGPEIVHTSEIIDHVYEERAGRLREVNIKNYFTTNTGVAADTVRSLEDRLPKASYPTPLAEVRLAADVVVISDRDGVPCILLHQNMKEPFKGKWSLPGGFVWQGETSRQTARRVVCDKVGIYCNEEELRQTYFADGVERDPRTRVASAVYLLNIGAQALGIPNVDYQWFPVNGIPHLAYDHVLILKTVLP